VGKKELSNMIPAGGKKPDAARPLPKDSPKGIEVYRPQPTTLSRDSSSTTESRPQTGTTTRCGRAAASTRSPSKIGTPSTAWTTVLCLDHLPPDLPERQIKSLRPYGKENYVILSSYPGQDAPVIATSWRVQLELKGADDPRLRRFVNEFRISEIAPLSGNSCTLGVGNPKG
jgi:Protein of unknown function (DUF3105)